MNLNIIQEDWNNQAVAHLEPACDDDYTINDVAFDVKQNKVSLFSIYEKDVHKASMILRLDDCATNKELVVVALGGKVDSGSLIQDLSDFWDRLAVQNGANKIRAHVSKSGMAKLMERVGGVLSEYVYKKEVSYGR
jgi:hypothetical protein